MSLSLVSLNVQRSKHLDVVMPFLKARGPDVFCLQEVCEHDIPAFASVFGGGGTHVFVPEADEFAEGVQNIEGIAIFSRIPFVSTNIGYYRGSAATVPSINAGDPSTYGNANRGLISVDVRASDAVYRVATTHFTWSPRGEATDEQRRDAAAMLAILEQKGELVLCGDFNAPRQQDGRRGEIYSLLAERFRDNIPDPYVTSLDVNLHRAGKIRPDEIGSKMVDYVFTTPAYTASGVELVFGVSDHAAVVATITRT